MPKFRIHGDNIAKKLSDKAISETDLQYGLIREIDTAYQQWVQENEALDSSKLDETAIVESKVALFDAYRNLLDEPKFDLFDSRGALQSSALEEFCYYLLRPLISSVEDKIAIGHHLVFQSLYFTSDNFQKFADFPTPNFPVNNLDFIIGKKISTTLQTETNKAEHPLYVPAVAIECKTYLDRPRFIESDIMAKNIKTGFPNCLYIVLSEFLKLDLNSVNVHSSQIDKIYVIRRKHNVDRKIRRAKTITLEPIYAPAILDLYLAVKDHLNTDWNTGKAYETGVLK